MPDASPKNAGTPVLSSRKRKSAAKSADNTFSATFRKLPWTYLHLALLAADATPAPAVDEIFVRTCITSALKQFLGLTGTAISVDILDVTGHDVYIRVPREDGKTVVEALSGWVGGGSAAAWRIKGRSEWLGALKGGDGQDLFD